MEKLTKLKMLSETGTFQGGFATLTSVQLLKLKGGSGTTNNCKAMCNTCNAGCGK